MITVLVGPPCSGKSTYVKERRAPGDLVLDLDLMAHALGYPEDHVDWDVPHPAVEAARSARSLLLKSILASPRGVNAWIVDADPPSWLVKKYRAIGAEIVELDPGKKICLARAKAGRSPSTQARIRDWYAART